MTASDLIAEQLQTAVNPVLWCSFGKDSLVLLDMILQVRKVPVIHIRYPKFPEKYRFVQDMTERYDLEVYDLTPQTSIPFQHGEYFDIIEGFDIGGRLMMPIGITKRTDEARYYCGLDALLRPKAAQIDYPWDVTFVGHKAADPIKLSDHVTNMQPVHQGTRTRMVYPLHDWTDDDIWTYIRTHDVPYEPTRYDDHDNTLNPDTLPTCYKCLDTAFTGQSVYCPKYNQDIPNMAHPAFAEASRAALLKSLVYCTPVGTGQTTAA